MKKITIASLLFFAISILSNAQEIKNGDNYYFTTNIDNQLLDDTILSLDGKQLDDFEILEKSQIKVLKTDEDFVYFKFLDFPKDSPAYRIYNRNIQDELRIFKIKKSRFASNTKTYYNRFRGIRYGTYTVPIRLRKTDGTFEFDSNLSLGASIVSRFSLSKFNEHFYLDISAGLSITKVNLNPENSDLGLATGDFADIEALSPAAITPTFGILLGVAENINIGTYIGWDHISTADNKANWIYNGKPWIGIGLNVVFSGGASNSNAASK